MLMYFAVQCHNFQKRLCWQLSSILEQVDNPIRIIIEVASLQKNGIPSTEKVIEEFKALGLDCNIFVYKSQSKTRFSKRGYIRSDQIKRAKKLKCDYIFFADCDNVYHPKFFNKLYHILNQKNLDKGVLSGKLKYHTDVTHTNRIVDRALVNGIYIRNAFIRANYLPRVVKNNKPIAGGGMQVCRLKTIFKLSKGVYVPAKKSKDRDLFVKGQKARSDIQFRRRMGGSIMVTLPPQIHLNHERDKEAGYHLEKQR